MVNKEGFDRVCAEWQRIYGVRFIQDNPVDWNKYVNSTPRILWILPEEPDLPNLTEYFRQISNNNPQYNNWQAAYGLLVKTFYSILNGIKDWKEPEY